MLQEEKAAQAQQLMRRLDLDCWLSFARETSERPDPGVDLLTSGSLTWNSALVLGVNGERVAIVGRYDAPDLVAAGVFDEVIGYDADLQPELLKLLERLNPRQIGLNYSLDDHMADGLSYGMFLSLQALLNATPFADRLVSAAPLLSQLRSQKTPSEIQRLRAAIQTSEQLLAQLEGRMQSGVSERELADLLHAELRARGLGTAWDSDHCPTVTISARSPLGHVRPQNDMRLQPGDLIRIDFGVRQDGYCADLQRVWYLLRPGETAAPEELQHAFDTCLAAIDAGARLLMPDVAGWEVDAAARSRLVAGGYPEYQHALGHGLGRACHDGGPLLGPRWPRYGSSPLELIAAGQVYTLELGVMTSAGYIGLEEDVLVTNDGFEYLSHPQRELRLLRDAG